MLSIGQSIILGLLQGLTELFPVSSLGHSVLLPALLSWNINESDNFFLVFLVATHLATALVLLAFFYKDWMLIIGGFFRSLQKRRVETAYEKLSWLIVIGTIPAGLLGLLLQKKFQFIFSSSIIVSIFLVLNGVMLFGMEHMRKKRSAVETGNTDEKISSLSRGKAFDIGLAQALALLPGFSRTGASLGGGLLSGLDHEAAARFSFLLATPIILAAAVLKLPDLIHANSSILSPVLIGAVMAAVSAYFSVKFLTRYFKTHTLRPFAIYCIAGGLVSMLILVLR